MNKARGFTLIEIMLTISLLAIIAFSAAPLTASLINSSDVTKTEGQLGQAIGKAKSLALRNAMGATGNTTVAAVCLSNTNVLTVEQGTTGVPPNCDTSDGTVVWSTQLSSKATVMTSESNVFVASSCMCFSNKGLLSDSVCGASSCVSHTVFQITVGNLAPELVSIF